MSTTQIIPSVSIATTALIVFVSLILPFIISSICLAGKFINKKAYFYGFGIFVMAELLFRAPLITALVTDESFYSFASTTAGIIVIGGLSAGLIDETMKYICAGKLLKKEISYNIAISFGFGTLCCELISVTGIKYIGNLIKMIVINNGASADIMNLEGAAQVIAELKSITPVSMIFDLASGISKAMMCLAVAILIMKSIHQKNPVFWIISIVVHTAFNCVFNLIPNEYAANGIAVFLGFMFMMYAVLSKDEFEEVKKETEIKINKTERNKVRSKNSNQSSNPNRKRKTQSGKVKRKKITHSNIENLGQAIINNSTDGHKNIIIGDEGSAELIYNTLSMKKQSASSKKINPAAESVSQGQDIRSIYKQNMNY